MYRSYMSVFCKYDNNLLLKCLREMSVRKKYGNWLKLDAVERLNELFLGHVNKILSLNWCLWSQKGNSCEMYFGHKPLKILKATMTLIDHRCVLVSQAPSCLPLHREGTI